MATRKTWQTYAREYDLIKKAESAAIIASSSKLPVPLKDIARDRRVQKVVFYPLLVTGCLAVGEGGFRIYIRCRSHEVAKYEQIFEQPDGDLKLPGRMRFTIAHELSHTYFYTENEGAPLARVAIRSSEELFKFEAFCNRMASEFLLPTTLVTKEATKFHFLEPKELREFVEFARVSPETIVIKTQYNKRWLGEYGGIMAVHSNSGTINVKAVAFSPHLADIFGHISLTLRRGKAFRLERLCSDAEFQGFANGNNGKNETIGIVEYKTQRGSGFQKFQFKREVTQNEDSKTFFITVRPVEEAWFE